MGTVFLNTIKQIGIFIICAQILMHFKRNESYEKYLKLLVSMMVMVQLLIPLFSLFKETSAKEFADKIAAYNKQLETDIKEIELIEVIAEEKRRQLTLEEVEERIQQKKDEQESGEDNGEDGKVIRIDEVEVRTDE